MDWTYKAVLTAVTVAAVLMAARLIGRRVAGTLAGLPVITVPALLWLAQEQGTDFAVQSAVGSAAACAMAPLFAAAFVGMARRHGAVLSLGCAVILAWAAVTVLQALQGLPALALLAATASCVLVLRAMGAPGGGALRRADAAEGRAASARRAPAAARALTRELSATAAVAGLVSAAVSLLAREVGPYWSGVLSTLPLISACALLHLHHVADHGALRGFVSGYVLGVLAKALFVCVFAWTAPLLGAAASMVVAALAGGAGALGLSRWHGRRVAEAVAAAAGHTVRTSRP